MPPRKKTSTLEDIKFNPEQVLADARARGGILSEVYPGERYADIRTSILNTGQVRAANGRHTIKVTTRPIDGTNEHEIMAIGAVVPRDPGRTQEYIDAIQDFLPSARKQKAQEVEQLWRIYKEEGIINNAVNKIAATLSTGGSFKVKKAKKGKHRKAHQLLQAIMDDFVSNVNTSAKDGVVTGSRGLQAVTHQAVRMALVEGDWIGRAVWSKKDVGVIGKYAMPVNIQSITTAQIEPLAAFSGTGVEAFYWKPPESILKLLDEKKDIPREIKDVVQRFIPREMQGPLKKDKKVFLDPALLLHIKHRGVDTEPFGESFIKPAMAGIAFKRAVEALDTVSMQNLINRLTIIMIGSDDPGSPYSKPEVQQARTALMQSMLEEPGPNMTLVWQGPDVKVEDVGANATLSLDERHKVAESKVKIALGVPDALLAGTTSDGKSAGWAAALGAAAELMELQNAFANAWTQIGQRIAFENGFEDVDILFEFDNSLMVDKQEQWTQGRLDAQSGLVSIRTYLKARGYDPDAEYIQKCYEKGLEADPEKPGSLFAEVFVPMVGLPGQGADGTAPPGMGGGNTTGTGRTPDSVEGKPAKPPKEKTPSTKETK